ncbi:MAG: pseudouridine synthase [Pleurocapsa sp.]
MSERIQKILSQWGIASRRKAEKMILTGRVRLNDQTAKLGDKVDLAVDKLEIDGKIIQDTRPSLVYLLLNKPTGVVSTCEDPQKRPTVLDLLPDQLKQGQGIHPVGRLDFASSGALLLTNDGDLTLSLTHPRYHIPKTYLVWLDGNPTNRDLARWREGVMLNDCPTLPAQVRAIKHKNRQTLLEIVLTEGKNRQIRRVSAQLGFKVLKLHRIAIGNINLNASSISKLAPGSYRHLTNSEIEFLKNYNSTFKLAAQASERSVWKTII